MPANVSPEYSRAERKYQAAHTFSEKIEALREMISLMPKHKGGEKLRKEMEVVRRRMQELYEKLPHEYENHGWVWLFLRKPAEVKTGRR